MQIHPDDYEALLTHHTTALQAIEEVDVHSILIELQDKAYALGLARGQKESQRTEGVR